LEVLEDRTVPSTFLVDNLGDDNIGSGLTGTLRYCINQANANQDTGNVIQFQNGLSGTILEQDAEPTVTKRLTINGPGASLITIDGNASFNVFTIASGVIANFSGLTLADGNVTGSGGAIANSGTLSLSDFTLVNNHADKVGGAISTTGNLSLNGCTVAGNSAAGGGGIALTSNTANLSLTTCTVSNNTADRGLGGGIASEGDLSISNSTISGNTAGAGGGGIFGAKGMKLNTSTISGNSATHFSLGGFVFPASGGGIYYQGAGASIRSCTITANTAEDFAGGIFSPGIINIGNTIVAGNSADVFGPDVYQAPFFGTFNSQGYNLIGATDGSSGWVNTDLTGTAANPLDPHLGPLADNGGPTQTHALLRGSPALNAGDPSLAGRFDQRGTQYSARPDIGAFAARAAVTLRLVAPAEVLAGEPFTVTVVAVDAWGNVASTYNGTVHFQSDDSAATLPAAYVFADTDGGSHSFEVTLRTPFIRQLVVTDPDSLFVAVVSILVQNQ
jgi:predicted outer membrane repeat protein